IATFAPGDPWKAKERPPASTIRSLPTRMMRSNRCASSIALKAKADCASSGAGPGRFLPAGRVIGRGQVGFVVVFVAQAQRVDAFSLHSSFFRRLSNVGGNRYRDFRMQDDPYRMHSQALDRPFENDLEFVDRKTRFGHRIGEIASRNRAVELALSPGWANINTPQPSSVPPISVASDFRSRLFASSWARWLSK